MPFVFYDTETTGTNPSFDQILQFAAIRTDEDLNVLERFEIRSRILPHVVPSAQALRVTGVRAGQLVDLALPSHYEMMRRIEERLLSWSPSLFLGYNSIEFDEHLLRHSLYKTLHLPYLTNTNGNSRSDVMRMVQATHLFRPGAITIPVGANGKPSYKLDRVAPANGIGHANAHDALADVEATIAICRLIAEEAPDVWSSFMRFGQKAAVIDHLASEPIFCYSDFHFGRPSSCLATGLGAAAIDSRFYIYDLSVDPNELDQMDDGALRRCLRGSPKPVRKVRCNASPMLMPAEDAPDFVVAKAPDTDELERRAEFIQDNEAFRERLIAMMNSLKTDDAPSPHVEEQLYDGFVQDEDLELLMNFHQAPWERRPAIVVKLGDDRLRQLGLALIHAERPDVLDSDQRQQLDKFFASRLLSVDDTPWLTAHKAESEFNSLIADADGDERIFLLEHLELLRNRKAWAEAMLGR